MNAIRRRAATAIALFTLCTSAAASDEQQLTDLLNEFLAGATRGDVATHERFWADDLIYTSSSGVRTDKARIVEGMRNAGDPATPPAIIYSADDIDVRLFGTTAIVAFRLVATPADSGENTRAAPVTYYLNTGTFLKRDDQWRAVAWQATRVPLN
ncbi:MAG: nuclear transport factor 2 family protein [Pseudomonadota bacterium]